MHTYYAIAGIFNYHSYVLYSTRAPEKDQIAGKYVFQRFLDPLSGLKCGTGRDIYTKLVEYETGEA